MKRWSLHQGQDVEYPKVDAFLQDIVAACQKHGMWLAHEDSHGAFVVQKESTESWLLQALVDDKGGQP